MYDSIISPKGIGWIILALVIGISLMIAGPLILIWSVNTLFSVGIPYSIETWVAALILGATVGPNIRVKKD